MKNDHVPTMMRLQLIQAGDSQDPYIFQALESWEKSYPIPPVARIEQLTHELIYVRKAATAEIFWWGSENEGYFERIFKVNFYQQWVKYGYELCMCRG